MQFVHPGFLWALAALAIPILIHLFQLRRFKRIDHPHTRFLQQVVQRTSQQRRIRHWLVLAARLLALAALVLAFAQPYIPRPNAQAIAGRTAVSLFLDDSYSMDGRNAGGRLLDQARSAAQDVVMAYSQADRFQLLTNRFEGRDQLLLGRDEALDRAAQVEAGPYVRPLSQVMARQREALQRSDLPNRRTILLTDLQRSVTDVDDWTDDSLITTVIVPLTPLAEDNLSLDSLWFDSPVRRLGRSEALHVRIRNHGGQDLENIPLRLAIDGTQRALATFAVAAGSTVDTVLRYTNDSPGDHWGVVELNDKPVTFDDRLSFAYRTVERPQILLIEGNDPASDRRIEAVFRSDSAYHFMRLPARNLNPNSLEKADLIIVNALPEIPSGMARSLANAVDAGGSLVVFPPPAPLDAGTSSLLTSFGVVPGNTLDTAALRVERMDLEHPFFKDAFLELPRHVDLPLARRHVALRARPGADILLRMQDGRPFLVSARHGRGTAYISAVSLDEKAGNFTRHALFVTSLLRMAELSRPSGPLYAYLGAEANLPLHGELPPGVEVLHLRGADGVDFVPELRRGPAGTSLVVHGQDLPDGVFAVTHLDDTLRFIALVRPRTESDLRVWEPEQLRAELEQRGLRHIEVLDRPLDQLAAGLKELDGGRKLWTWSIWAALLALVAEVILIRWKS